MDNDLKLSSAMIHELEVTGLDDVMRPGPTRTALMRRGLVSAYGSGQFGYLTPAGRELAAELQAIKAGEHWSDKADAADAESEQGTASVDFGKGCRCDWLGKGTPEHAPSALCRSPRPDADRDSALPDPTVTGPCQVQATFMCTGEAAGQRLIPTSMLPDSLIPGPLYAPMCLACYEHLADAYLTTLHKGASA